MFVVVDIKNFCAKVRISSDITKFFRTFAIEMAGLYVHIPFCGSRCIYCGFYSTTASSERQRYVDAVCREMTLRPLPADGGDGIGTVYLGGGTPSQLSAGELRQLFSSMREVYGKDRTFEPVEVTMECNPDDVTAALAETLSALPVNRVSMGVQSFDDVRLRFLRRRHTASQVAEAVGLLRGAGIGNISIDLMYGFPGETVEEWVRDIDAAVALGVEHISAYCLTYEEGTPLFGLLERGAVSELGEELCLEMYSTLIDRLTAAGFEHYEISNFARSGYRSLHNCGYWTDVPYVGIGAAAHGYDGRQRYWNVSDIYAYMEGIEEGRLVGDGELIDDAMRYNDRVMLSLRTCEGLRLDLLPPAARRYCLSQAQRFIDGGELRLAADPPTLTLSRRGLFVSDMVMSALMMV